MATYNRPQLRTSVLSRLGVLDPAQGPSAEDAATVDQAIQTTLEVLYDDGLIPFDVDTDAIPAPFLDALSFIVAFPLVADFGAFARTEFLALQDRNARKTLRRLKAAPYVGGTTQADYF